MGDQAEEREGREEAWRRGAGVYSPGKEKKIEPLSEQGRRVRVKLSAVAIC